MPHFLLTPFGSAGDVNPFIWMGKLLKARGHEVTLITYSGFKEYVERAGLDFVGVGSIEEFEAIMLHPDLWKPFHGTALVFEQGGKLLRPCYEEISSRIKKGKTVLVSPFQQFASRLAREKHGVPLVTVHLQPVCFLSAHDTPLLFSGMEWSTQLPPWLTKAIFSLPTPAEYKLGPILKRLCAELEIPAPRRVIPDWMHSPDANVALFPDWFAAPQPDWPENTTMAGFPLEDLKGQFSLPPDLERWLKQGDKPVLFSPGTGNAQGRLFFEAGLAACERLGLRALVGSRFLDHLPQPLPPWAWHFDYLPFSELLPHVACIVHHGGIGTMSQAFAAGVPQLVMPMAHDQPDNAMRMERLGAGVSLTPRQFTGKRVAAALASLMNNANVQSACDRVKAKCAEGDAAKRVLDVLERVI